MQFQKKSMNNLFEKINSHNFFLDRPLEILHHKHSTLFPIKKINTSLLKKGVTVNLCGGLLKSDMTFCDFAKTIRIPPDYSDLVFNDWYINPPLNKEAIQNYNYIDEDVVFIGPMSVHYGHFITEGLSRLWLLLDNNYKDLKIAYISEAERDKFNEFFLLFGIKKSNIIRINEPTKFKSIIVPEPSIRLHDYCHEMYGETITQILKNVKLIDEKDIFLTKKATRWTGKSIGEKYIQKVFLRNGFEIVCPEEYSIDEFLSLMLSAKTLVASSGTSAHNAVFMKKQSELICLNRSDHHHHLQIMINKIRDLKVTHVDTSFNVFNNPNLANGPFNIVITSYLLDFLKRESFKLPSKLFIAYTFLKSTSYYLLYTFFLQKMIYTFMKIKIRLQNEFNKILKGRT